MRYIICSIAVFIMLFTYAMKSEAKSPPIQVYIDGQSVEFVEAEPYIENGVTFVPFRPIFESLGMQVSWDSATRTVTGKNEGLLINLVLYQREATVNGKQLRIEAAPRLERSVTFVPIRFVSEAAGKEVEWDGSGRTIKINSVPIGKKLLPILASEKLQYMNGYTLHDDPEKRSLSITYNIDTEAIISLKSSLEIQIAINKIMDQLKDTSEKISRLPAINSYRLQAAWGDQIIYDWNFVKIEDDPGETDEDSDMRVTLNKEKGVELQYKVQGKWNELTIQDAAHLSDVELEIVDFFTSYFIIRNKQDVEGLKALMQEELRKPETFKGIEKGLVFNQNSHKQIAMGITKLDKINNDATIDLVEEVNSGDNNETMERKLYIRLNKNNVGNMWQIADLTLTSVIFPKIEQEKGSYHLGKHAPYFTRNISATISPELKDEVSKLLADRVKAMSDFNMEGINNTSLLSSPIYEESKELESFLREYSPKVSFQWGQNDLVFLNVKEDEVHVATKLYYRLKGAPAGYDMDVIYVLKKDASNKWKVYDSYTTKIFYYSPAH